MADRTDTCLNENAFLPPWHMAGMPKETPVLLAFSGGMDSRVLLHLLSVCASRDRFSVFPVHVNHHIRGEESERDAAFCRKIAERYGMELILCEADVPALAKQHGKSLEEEAREVRYAYFEQIMREKGIPLLVTAHHADDQLETVLFRLCRGTGLQGLCGIAPVRVFGTGFLVRPLLPYTRCAIAEYCRREQLDYMQDSTNADVSYTRNLIRMEAVPVLERVIPEPQKSVYRMTQSLKQDFDFIETSVRAFLSAHRTGGRVPLSALNALHPAVRRRVFSAMIPNGIDASHAEAIERLAAEGVSGSGCSVPGGYRACVQNGMFAVLPVMKNPDIGMIPFREGTVGMCDENLTVSVRKAENLTNEIKVHNLSTDRYIILNTNSDIMLKRPYWKNREEGDALLIHGVRRKLRRLYRDAGIPPLLRAVLPVLYDAEGVLWAPYIGLRDGIPKEGKEGLLIEVTARGWDIPL